MALEEHRHLEISFVLTVDTNCDGGDIPPLLADCQHSVDALRAVGRLFYQREWSVGTSSNYSVVINREPLELLVTASGMDKGQLRRRDFVRVGSDGLPTSEGQPKSSAETMLHVVATRHPEIGAVLHTHSVWGTILSDLFFEQGGLQIEGYEMLKGLAGVRTHETSAWVPIFENTQDISSLAERVVAQWDDEQQPIEHGFLIRRHGLYTWGADLDEARRHIEIYEFLFQCIARRMLLEKARDSYYA